MIQRAASGSLSPCGRPTPVEQLCAVLRERTDWLDGLPAGLKRLEKAERRHFPENLFRDQDYLALSLLREVRGVAGKLAERLELIESIYALYGCESPIRFRYLHDFLYGFDWAKYLDRNPDQRGIAPFSGEFLLFMHRRGEELVQLVQADDPTYHRLRAAGHRNPFPFSREPGPEALLHRKLAAKGLIPVETWNLDARPDHARPYQALREQEAAGLELTLEHHGDAP